MNRGIEARLRTLVRRVDALSLRERLLALFVLLGGLWLAFDAFWIGPGWDAVRNEKQAIGAAQNRIASLQAALQEALRGEDPIAVREARLSALETELEARRRKVEAALGRLPAPREIPRLLRALLGSGALRLRRMERTPDADIPFEDMEAMEAEVRVAAYRLELEGGWFEALAYLRRLEALPWAFFQERIRYEVREWPQARLQLRLLALERGE